MPVIYQTMPDGTIKQVNPFSGTEVWTVPGRANRPLKVEPKEGKPLERHRPEDYCNFCEAKYLNTPPEKARIVRRDGKWVILKHLPLKEILSESAEFRRVANLFEIVTMDYWRMNHGYHLSPENRTWKEEYLASPEGRDHVKRILALKWKLSGKSDEEAANLTEEEILKEADAFFGGGHELIIARRHYKDDAQTEQDLAGSGDLTQEEHFWYFKATIEAARDIYENNRYARYISIFQNWLKPAGASFDHLHKQLVALDEWGSSVEQEIDLVEDNPNAYNEWIVNFAGYSNLVFAENDYAIALAEVGHRFPTIGIYSKSRNARPTEHTDEEIRGFSNLVHACHAATGNQMPCNEEWYHAPRDSIVKMPWHILIKWRIISPAGFEGGTKIYINPVGPVTVRDAIVPRLYKLRDQGWISDLRIAEECKLTPNCLRYIEDERH